jgi:hypothetical protein
MNDFLIPRLPKRTRRTTALRQVRIDDAGRDGIDAYGSGDDCSASIGTGAIEQLFRFVNSIQECCIREQ